MYEFLEESRAYCNKCKKRLYGDNIRLNQPYNIKLTIKDAYVSKCCNSTITFTENK